MTPDEFVRRHGPTVYNLALRLTGNAADAADIAQDSLVKALKGLPDFRGGDPGAWAYRITVNAWKNWLRAKSSRRVLRFFSMTSDGVNSEPENAASPEPGPADIVAAADEKARIDRALARLTPEERAVLVLRELEGQSYEDVAATLGIPLGTVKSRLARARALLAEELSREKDEPS